MAVLSVGSGGSYFGPGGESPDDRIDLLRRVGEGVVLVGAAGSDTEYRSLNQLVRLGLAPGVRVHVCSAPPSLLGLVTSVMQSGRFGAGDVLEVLSAVRAVATTVAIVDSVASLASPRPTLLQHARSLLPGGHFVVDLPGDRVHSGAGALGRLQRMHSSCLFLASAGDPVSDRWRDELRGLAPHAPVLEVGRPQPSAVPWRTGRWAECTGLAVPVPEFANRLDGYLARRECVSCGARVAGPVCPLCGVVSAAHQAGRRPGVPGRTPPGGVQRENDPDATPAFGVPVPALAESDLEPTVRAPHPRAAQTGVAP